MRTGVIEVVNKRSGRPFTDNDCALLSTLATYAAASIHKTYLYADLENLFLSTITALANAIEAKDPCTRGHSERIRNLSLLIADELNMSKHQKKNLEIAALLHDIGKIGVPEHILGKQSELTDKEYEEIKKHPEIGARMLSSIAQLTEVLPGVRCHQERFDGKGYPLGLKGKEIPLFARIISVADTFDAMTSDRPYRKALSYGEALREIGRQAGVQFDRSCALAFLRGYKKRFHYEQQL